MVVLVMQTSERRQKTSVFKMNTNQAMVLFSLICSNHELEDTIYTQVMLVVTEAFYLSINVIWFYFNIQRNTFSHAGAVICVRVPIYIIKFDFLR